MMCCYFSAYIILKKCFAYYVNESFHFFPVQLFVVTVDSHLTLVKQKMPILFEQDLTQDCCQLLGVFCNKRDFIVHFTDAKASSKKKQYICVFSHLPHPLCA